MQRNEKGQCQATEKDIYLRYHVESQQQKGMRSNHELLDEATDGLQLIQISIGQHGEGPLVSNSSIFFQAFQNPVRPKGC